MSISVALSCFQPFSATKVAINSIGSVRIGNKNCFLEAETGIFSGSGDLRKDYTDEFETSYGCNTCESNIKCSGQGEYDVSGGDLNIVGCLWEGESDRFLRFISGKSAVILECRFLNCGDSKNDGGVLHFVGFSTRVFVGGCMFKGVSGGRGNIFINNDLDTTFDIE
jgi:hypothetical protein